MKKIFYSLLMVCAMFAAQNVNAQEEKTVIFEETFEKSLGDFKIEGDKAWFFNGYNSINYANFSVKGKPGLKGETYLVSPVIANGTKSVVSFSHLVTGVTGGFEQLAGICVRTEGGEWTALTGAKFPMDFDQLIGTEVSSGDVVIPEAFDNKNIQIALFVESYKNDLQAGWYVRNLKVSSVAANTGIETVENEAADNKYYDLKGREAENPQKGIYIHNGKKVVIK